MQGGVVLLQLGADEGVEVITVEEGLGALSEVFLVIGQAVVLHLLAGVEEDVFVGAGGLGLLEAAMISGCSKLRIWSW